MMSVTTRKLSGKHQTQRSDVNTAVAPQGNPAAVLVGLDSMQGLQAARILAARDVPVIGVAASKSNAFCKTWACKEIRIAPTAHPELIDHLMQLGATLDEKAVLFPCEDNNVLLVSRHREQLQRYFHVLLPDAETVEMLMDKVLFYTFANENQLPIPPTHFIWDERQMADVATQLNYPCVLKPRDSAATRWEDETIFKAFKLHDAAALLATYKKFQGYTDCFIVQEWVEGDDSDLYSCNCYFDANSNPLVTFVARKLRQWPPETGISCLGEEVRNDIVLRETLRLFRSVNYRGLGYLEMKRDRRSGHYWIVEPNIGRPTGRSAIAEAGGVPLLYTAYCDAIGKPLPPDREQTYQGVKWIHMRKDLQSSFQYWRRGQLTFGQWWRSLRGRKAHALASWRDPMPFLADWLGAFTSLFSRRKRKKRDAAKLKNPNRSRSNAATSRLFRFAGNPLHRWWIESILACRGVLFLGNKFTCPCCGWRLRTFTEGGVSIKPRHHGYCPRCNSKARHRRDWLFLREHTNLFRDRLKLLHVSPKYALSRRLTKMPNLEFVGVDLEKRPHVSSIVDITSIPFPDNSFDAVICIHVLEHVESDRCAMSELFRVLRPGGWALITVPVRLDQPTVEDPSVVSPQDRKRLFGEEQHVRYYGMDLVERLESSGFSVQIDRGRDLAPDVVKKYGLLEDENVFLCSKT